jgi:hypothetical protein
MGLRVAPNGVLPYFISDATGAAHDVDAMSLTAAALGADIYAAAVSMRHPAARRLSSARRRLPAR